MSDDQGTQSAQPGSTESDGSTSMASPNPAPAAPPATHSQSAPQWATDLGNAINALPETIARSVKEAVGQPKSTHAPAVKQEEKKTEETTDKKETTSQVAEPGKRQGDNAYERFQNWWFKR